MNVHGDSTLVELDGVGDLCFALKLGQVKLNRLLLLVVGQEREIGKFLFDISELLLSLVVLALLEPEARNSLEIADHGDRLVVLHRVGPVVLLLLIASFTVDHELLVAFEATLLQLRVSVPLEGNILDEDDSLLLLLASSESSYLGSTLHLCFYEY